MLISSSVLDTTHPGPMFCKTKCEEIDVAASNLATRENINNCQTLGYSNDVDACIVSILI